MIAAVALVLAYSMPHGIERSNFCETARAIVREAGSEAAAEQLARRRGYSQHAIQLAKRICKREN